MRMPSGHLPIFWSLIAPKTLRCIPSRSKIPRRNRPIGTRLPSSVPVIAISLGHDRVDGGRQVGEIA
jgi:hypothetical protein